MPWIWDANKVHPNVTEFLQTNNEVIIIVKSFNKIKYMLLSMQQINTRLPRFIKSRPHIRLLYCLTQLQICVNIYAQPDLIISGQAYALFANQPFGSNKLPITSAIIPANRTLPIRFRYISYPAQNRATQKK